MKRILIVGASGAIGAAVAKDLGKDFEVITASRNDANNPMDVLDKASIDAALKSIGKIDGVITCFGKAEFGDLADIDLNKVGNGLGNKFVGQVQVVQSALGYLNEGASITLTSGILNDQTIKGGVFAAAANGALNAFAQALALELNGKARVNIVSPSLIADSVQTMGHMFQGFEVTSMPDLTNAYRHCVTGMINGKILRLYRPI